MAKATVREALLGRLRGLKLRPTGLGSGIDKDRPDYTVYCGEWGVGRIYRHFQKRMPYGLFVPDVPV